jgi:hypothetical protein
MPETDSTPNQGPHSSVEFLHRIMSVITLRRVGLSVAGTFAFVGAAAFLNNPVHVDNVGTPAAASRTTTTSANASSASDESPSTQKQNNASGSSQQSSGASSNTSFSSTTANGQTSTHLNMNGQDVPIPTNGSMQQTVINADGSQTTVSSSSSTVTQNSVNNQSSSTITFDVTTNSSSTNGSPSP